MTNSIKFEGIGTSETVNSSYSHTLKQDIESSYKEDFSKDVSKPCETESREGVGLWQYVQKSTDGKSYAYS